MQWIDFLFRIHTGLALFYFVVALIASFALCIQFLLSLFATDDLDGMHDADTGIWSIRTLTAFFFGFGWAGLWATKRGHELAGSLAIAMIAGVACLVLIYGLVVFLRRLHSDGTQKIENAVGQHGTVYLTVPRRGEGTGQVSVIVQGSLTTYPAITDEHWEIPSHSAIKVIGVAGNMLRVAPADSAAG